MRLRQAKKIMKKVMAYPCMHWVYGSGKMTKASNCCIRHYARVDKSIKEWNVIANKFKL